MAREWKRRGAVPATGSFRGPRESLLRDPGRSPGRDCRPAVIDRARAILARTGARTELGADGKPRLAVQDAALRRRRGRPARAVQRLALARPQRLPASNPYWRISLKSMDTGSDDTHCDALQERCSASTASALGMVTRIRNREPRPGGSWAFVAAAARSCSGADRPSGPGRRSQTFATGPTRSTPGSWWSSRTATGGRRRHANAFGADPGGGSSRIACIVDLPRMSGSASGTPNRIPVSDGLLQRHPDRPEHASTATRLVIDLQHYQRHRIFQLSVRLDRLVDRRLRRGRGPRSRNEQRVVSAKPHPSRPKARKSSPPPQNVRSGHDRGRSGPRRKGPGRDGGRWPTREGRDPARSRRSLRRTSSARSRLPGRTSHARTGPDASSLEERTAFAESASTADRVRVDSCECREAAQRPTGSRPTT